MDFAIILFGFRGFSIKLKFQFVLFHPEKSVKFCKEFPRKSLLTINNVTPGYFPKVLPYDTVYYFANSFSLLYNN